MKSQTIITKCFETADKSKIERGLNDTIRELVAKNLKAISISVTSYIESESKTSTIVYTILADEL